MTPAHGGYCLSGDWRYGSGIDAAQWVMVTGLLAEDAGRGRLLQCVVSREDLVIADNWQVHGLKGTGSSDFSGRHIFVPEALTFSPVDPPQRGGRQYRTATVGYLAYTLPGVVCGVARRVLDELTATASTTKRGYARPRPLAEWATFQHFLGEADQKLKAARALMVCNGQALMGAVDEQGRTSPAQEAETRAAAAFATRVAVEVVHDAARFACGGGVRTGHVLEQALRDVTMASTHLLISESAYENHGQFQLGIPGADPMG